MGETGEIKRGSTDASSNRQQCGSVGFLPLTGSWQSREMGGKKRRKNAGAPGAGGKLRQTFLTKRTAMPNFLLIFAAMNLD